MQEVHKLRFRGAEHSLQVLGTWSTRLPSGVRNESRVAVGVKEHLDPGRTIQNLQGRHPVELHDAGQLLHLVLSGEQRVARIQLRQDAPKGPHVDGRVIRDAQNHFWGPVETTLDVRVDTLIFEARGSQVDHLDAALRGVLEQHVLWLQVTVDDVLLPKETQRRQELNGETADEPQRDSLEVVVLDEFVKVDAEQFEGDTKVIPKVEVIHHVHDVGGALEVLLPDVLQDLHFHKRLMVESLLVANYLQSHTSIVGLEVSRSDNLSEGSLSKRGHHLVAVQEMVVQNYGVVPALIIVAVVVGGG
mmetsp:Transcript_24009/g.42929  ORF Transcript_24009/g.42929 Transcript_24009/m.42929 type:complete len:303 (-) Transcript_24009:952-1860(-)